VAPARADLLAEPLDPPPGRDREAGVGQLAHEPLVQRERARRIGEHVLARLAGAEQRVVEARRPGRRALDLRDRLRQRRAVVGAEPLDEREPVGGGRGGTSGQQEREQRQRHRQRAEDAEGAAHAAHAAHAALVEIRPPAVRPADAAHSLMAFEHAFSNASAAPFSGMPRSALHV
jgi:hypothetical protein